MSPLHVLFLSAEAEPFTRVGSLAEMAGVLPRALRSLPVAAENGSTDYIDIRLVIPFHGQMRPSLGEINHLASFTIQHTNGAIPVEVYATQHNQVPVYLISGGPIGEDSPVYSHDPGYDANKYIFFSLASLELCRHLNWHPDIVHANDWHTAPAVYWLSQIRARDDFFASTRSVLTIHNMAYLGVGANFSMYAFGLPPSQDAHLPEWARQLPLPLGILHADWITTCSPAYAREIHQPESSSGLDNLLNFRADCISGIMNGVDRYRWDPSNDPYLPVSYTADSLGVREANKIALLSQLGLLTKPREKSTQNTLLIGLVGPLDYQKGTDLAIEALYQMAGQHERYTFDWRAIILGSGLPELEASAHALEEAHSNLVRFVRRFETPLIHQTYGALDVLLIPARSAPYDLNALIGLRYASVPVAHATGSLVDVIDEENGFLFTRATPDAAAQAVKRSARVFQNATAWRSMQLAGMKRDFTWRRTAMNYGQLYRMLLTNPIKSTPT